MPFMNYDLYWNYSFLQKYYSGRWRWDTSNTTQYTPRMLMEHDLSRYLYDPLPLHPRRTLDQFYYPSLENTRARDADQTLSKWTEERVPSYGRARAMYDSILIMIDQLWCWVIDDSTFNFGSQLFQTPLKHS
jgi:hypothetical protein